MVVVVAVRVYDTSSAVCLRSSLCSLLDRIMVLPFPLRSPTRSYRVQLEAVWSLPLYAGSEGSSLIFCPASHSSTLAVRSWRTFVDRPCSPDLPSVLTERGGQLRTKRLHPVQHRSYRHIKVPLG